MNKFLINNRIIRNIAGPSVIAMFFIGDRLLKLIAQNQGSILSRPLIGHLLSFHYVPNPGIAFSIIINKTFLNISLSLIVLGLLFAIFYLILKKNTEKCLLWPLTLILFGAISNLTDRYLYGVVVDYFDLQYFSIFNLADAMITAGVIIMILKIYIYTPPKKKLKKWMKK